MPKFPGRSIASDRRALPDSSAKCRLALRVPAFRDGQVPVLARVTRMVVSSLPFSKQTCGMHDGDRVVIPPRAAVHLQACAANGRWEHAGQRYFDGEVEPCINGRTIETGAYFGVDVSPLVARVAGRSAHRRRLELRGRARLGALVVRHHDQRVRGPAGYERATGGDADLAEARRTAEEYLLERRLFRRQSTGEVVDPGYLQLAFPSYWHYDVLRALDHFRRDGRGSRSALRRGHRGRPLEAPARRPVAARTPLPRTPLRARGRRRRAEPLDHVVRPTRPSS